MRRGYLLDTNQLSLAAAKRGWGVVAKLRDAASRGVRVGTCVPVLCEIEAGFAGMTNAARYRAELRHLLRLVAVWPIDLATAAEYGQAFQELRTKGRARSQVDMMLAAMTRQHRLVLVTSDPDFTALPEVPTENWLNPAP